MSKEMIVTSLLALFRQYGYDGVTVSRISAATGLGKASLYHHFPGGKEQMAMAVLQFISKAVDDNFIAPLKGEGAPRQKLVNMAKVVNEFYESGSKGCLIDGLTLGDAEPLFQEHIAAVVEAWISAIAAVAVEAGISKKSARERAEDVVIAVEGSLVLSRALASGVCFRRIIKDIPAMVLD